MKITIKRNEAGEPVVIIDSKEELISYETLEKIIDQLYGTDDKYEFVTDKDLLEYENLIDNIIKKARTNDFRTAVREARSSNENLQKCETEIEQNNKDGSKI
jgi:hypothetical protein